MSPMSAYRCVLSASPVYQSFFMVLSLACMQHWQPGHRVLQADECGRSISFRATHGFPLSASSNQSRCFLVDTPTTSAVVSSSMVFVCFHCSPGSAAVTQRSLSSNMTWRFFTLGSRSLCTCSFFVWGPFLLGGGLKAKATLQRTSHDQCSSLHLAPLCCVVRLSCHAAELGRSPRGASVWSVGVSMLP